MKLRELHFDDLVVIPGWQRMAGGTAYAREQSFHSDEGWTLERTDAMTFRLYREGMPKPVTVEGYPASYVVAPIEAVAVEGPAVSLDDVAVARAMASLPAQQAKRGRRR